MYTSIKQLKDHLSEYVHRVQQGEELVITSHKQPIAKLVPIAKNEIELANKNKKLLADIEALQKKQSKLKSKETMHELVIKLRKQERY